MYKYHCGTINSDYTIANTHWLITCPINLVYKLFKIDSAISEWNFTADEVSFYAEVKTEGIQNTLSDVANLYC